MSFDLEQIYKDNEKQFIEIDKIINEEGVSLFGAGVVGNLYSSFLLENNFNIHCFLDNNKNKENTYLNNIPILINSDNINLQSKAILLAIHRGIDNAEKSLPKKYITMSIEKYFFMKYYREFMKVRKLFTDDFSKIVLDNVLYAKFMCDEKHFQNIYDSNQYFSLPVFSNFILQDEVFLDAGAYLGDTIEKFIYSRGGIFQHIYGFEPGKKQLNAMINRVERLKKEWAIDDEKITLVEGGLYKENTEFYFNDSNMIANNNITTEKTNNIVKLYSIDKFVKNNYISFLKADIEGSEYPMLEGAIETIKKSKPKIAISVYHKPSDIFKITNFLKSLVPEYKLSLRHHSIGFSETVLYCYID